MHEVAYPAARQPCLALYMNGKNRVSCIHNYKSGLLPTHEESKTERRGNKRKNRQKDTNAGRTKERQTKQKNLSPIAQKEEPTYNLTLGQWGDGRE